MEELAIESITFITKSSLDTERFPSCSSPRWVQDFLFSPGRLRKLEEFISLSPWNCGLVILGYASSISGQNTYQAVVTYMCDPSIGKLCEISVRSVPKEISIQKYTSVIGTLAAAYLTVAITVKYHTRPVREINLSPLYSNGISSWASMFSVVPTICFGFQCHEACIAIYSNMKNRKLSHWVFISVVSMFICLIIYSLTGIYGYLTFGKNVAPDILMSCSGGDITMIIARLLFGISIITVYPIIVLLGRSVIQDPLLKRRRKHTVVTESYECQTRVALTTAWVTVTLVIAVFVPDISKVISVVGGISAFFIFIFPGLCLIFAVQSEAVSPTLRYLLITWGVITLFCGTYIFGQSTSIAVMQLLNEL